MHLLKMNNRQRGMVLVTGLIFLLILTRDWYFFDEFNRFNRKNVSKYA